MNQNAILIYYFARAYNTRNEFPIGRLDSTTGREIFRMFIMRNCSKLVKLALRTMEVACYCRVHVCIICVVVRRK